MKKNSRCFNTPIVLAVVLNFVFHSAVSVAGPPIPGFYGSNNANLPSVSPNALPVELPAGLMKGASVTRPATNRLEVHQHQPKAIIDWQSFNIGKNAWTHFDQQKHTDWSALNRIYDQNPSQIFGRLTADGKVFLINQNGILFGPTSRVNVHSLVASSLNISNQDFSDGLWKFKAEDYISSGQSPSTDAAVSNHGEIRTGDGGSVFLLAPTAENAGQIITPDGRIVLGTGTQVDVDASGSVVVEGQTRVAGVAVNFEDARLIADSGRVGMFGRNVYQDGLIRSVRAIQKDGKVQLMATEKVTTGEKSLTKGGRVEIAGEGIHHKGMIDVSNEVARQVSLQHPGNTLKLLDEGSMEPEDLDAGEIIMHAGQEGVVLEGSLQARAGKVAAPNWERVLLGSGLVDPKDLPDLVSPDSELTDAQLEAKKNLLTDDWLDALREDFNVVLSNEGLDLELPGAGGSVSIVANGDVEIGSKSELYARQVELAGSGKVSSRGRIETDLQGSVLVGAEFDEQTGAVVTTSSSVENHGEIVSSGGQIVVAANESALNSENGQLIADGGAVGMYAMEVRQDGLIQAVSTRRQKGKIELLATEKVITGEKSRTISPVSDSSEAEHESFGFGGGEITIAGLNQETAVRFIEHRGKIDAPSGKVSLQAEERAYLESGSRIDVSGNWVDQPAEANIVKAQLNSVELRDDYGQKGGVLQGEEITFDASEGSSIGNIGGSLLKEETTALEMSTRGGTIEIDSGAGDIIVRDGALLDFSGGGIQYSGGHEDTTKLLAFNRIYDISQAPLWIHYDAILGLHRNEHERFGITETYPGLYCGGVTPLKNYSAAHVEGHDAGLLALLARNIILDGTLDGSATAGFYQTELSEPTDEYGIRTARGRTEPRGGILNVGGPFEGGYYQDRDPVVEEIVVQSGVKPLSEPFDPETSPFPEDRDGKTYLSAHDLNGAKLHILVLSSRARCTLEEDAKISLAPGGRFTAASRSILHQAEINVSSGKVNLVLASNITTEKSLAGGGQNPHYISPEELGPERIYLAEGSSILAAGERIDNAFAGESVHEPLRFGRIHGGEVKVMDKTLLGEGVILKKGGLIDVSGGYEIKKDGAVSAGNAGAIRFQGSTLIVEGNLLGHSLVGGEGGTIDLHADRVSVVLSDAPSLPEDFDASDPMPVTLKGALVLNDNRLDATGFADVTLKAWTDATVVSGASLSPSRVKLAAPVPGGSENAHAINRAFDSFSELSPDSNDLMAVPDDYLGATSVALVAGKAFEGEKETPLEPSASTPAVTLRPGSRVRVAPEGKITIKGPAVDLYGVLEAPSGEVGITASTENLVLRSGSQVLAAGYNKAELNSVAEGLPVDFAALPGGEVKLHSVDGNLIIESGALVDVSGSAPTRQFFPEADGTLFPVTVASDAGSIELVSLGDLTLQGELVGHRKLEGLRGGALAICKRDLDTGLTISSDELIRYTDTDSGFDDLTFQSWKALNLTGSVDLDVGRRLCLDAPQISGSGEDEIRLKASWVQLVNSYYPGAEPVTQGSATLTLLSSGFIDVEGDVKISGFESLYLNARQDVRLSDRHYSAWDKKPVWQGGLETAADLTIQAARIYPATESDFTIHSGGKLATKPADAPLSAPVFSAGAHLTIEAEEIEHTGILAAPMGEIALVGDNRVYLAQGSRLTTRGESPVSFGFFDQQHAMFWNRYDKSHSILTEEPVEAAPEKSIEMRATEVIVREGAEIDFSGGGSVFAYRFLAGVEGSVDPLKIEGRYVILPDDPMALPGEAVYLTCGAEVGAGTYSLLPEEYAFLPGAIIIEDVGPQLASGDFSLSEEGYSVVSGYAAFVGSTVRSPEPHMYRIRPAEDVLKEGALTYAEFAAGDAGNVRIVGETTILDGTVSGEGLPGFHGGRLTLSGKNVLIGAGSAPLPTEFDFASTVPDDLMGKLHVATATLSQKGLREIKIGEVYPTEYRQLGGTETVTMEEGCLLEVSGTKITLSAISDITLKSGARIHALGDGGKINLVSTEECLAILRQRDEVAPDVQNELTINIEENARIQASDEVHLAACGLDLHGDILVENGSLNLGGPRIVFVPEGYSAGEAEGLLVTDRLWSRFGDFQNVGLLSESEVAFLGDFDLKVAHELIIDAGRIVYPEAGDGGTVTIAAKKIDLLNSLGPLEGGLPELSEAGVLTLEAFSDMTIGLGHVDGKLLANDLLFDGFREVNLKCQNDLTLKGRGTLKTDGDLNIVAARVTASLYQYEVINHQNGLARKQRFAPANVCINTGTGAVAIYRSDGLPGETSTEGGNLEVLARSIDHTGLVDMVSGQVRFIATGSAENDGVFLRNGAEILAFGRDDTPAGAVSLSAEQGVVKIDACAAIDVSAGTQGDAGTVSLYAPQEGVVVGGVLKAKAQGGRGGSFALDTKEVKNFSELNAKLSEAGFNHAVDLRARAGDIAIGEDDTVKARTFKMVADEGDIHVYGKVDASGESEGGRVDLYAKNDLNLYGTSFIDACGTGAEATGGEVLLSAGHVGPDNAPTGELSFESGAGINVSGGGTAQKGTVHFRALRSTENNDVHMDLHGTVTGASRLVAEAVRIYKEVGDYNITHGDVDTETVDGWYQESQEFLANASLNVSDWEGEYSLLPGIEVRSTGDLTLAVDWDLTSWRFGEEPGVLTLRADGDLSIDNNLVDHPTPPSELQKDSALDSWALNLVAGADIGSADFLAIPQSDDGKGGNLVIADAKLVYTESSPIRFASQNDTLIGSGQAATYMTEASKPMNYNMGTYDGSIRGRVGSRLSVKGGAIQSATGNIDITVGGDLVLGRKQGALGSIRTIGQQPPSSSVPPGWESFSGYWNNVDGGHITLDVQGRIEGFPSAADPWDTTYYGYEENASGEVVLKKAIWSASYEGQGNKETRGLVTMGGGDLEVHTGGDFGAPIGTFGAGTGDLIVYAGGNIDGRFLVRNGLAELVTMGDFGAHPAAGNLAIEVFDGRITLTAEGCIELGTILNPTIANDDFNDKWNLEYSEDAEVKLLARQGDVTLAGDTQFYPDNLERRGRRIVLPPSLEVSAGRDIRLLSEFYLAPSPTGNLRLEAVRDIDGQFPKGSKFERSGIYLSDVQPSQVYGDHTDELSRQALGKDYLFKLVKNPWEHTETLLHADDPVPVSVVAGRDIRNLLLFLPKQAQICAGQDIRDMYVLDQNLNSTDVTAFHAGRDILFSSTQGFTRTRIAHGGPGVLSVQAGNNIDLGTSLGIQAVGNQYNPWLGKEKNVVAMVSGVMSDFFSDLDVDLLRLWSYVLRELGVEYSDLLAGGQVQEADDLVALGRAELIGHLFEDADTLGEGSINMVNSKISTSGSPGDFHIVANGDLNVGKTTFRLAGRGGADTGIYTASGGSINIYAEGDVNVNESRVMTFMGGDITTWSNHGNINAGRGSKTAINSPPPTVKILPNGEKVVTFNPPAVGSGIRTLSFDPDGLQGPKEEPEPGDIYLFAPAGEIDAGEAGIAGKNVILGATEIVNAENISFSQGSVGVPVASEGGAGLGALAGAGALAEVSKLTEETTGVASARGRVEQEMADFGKAFTPNWLKVEFIGFDEEKKQ